MKEKPTLLHYKVHLIAERKKTILLLMVTEGKRKKKHQKDKKHCIVRDMNFLYIYSTMIFYLRK